MTQFFAILKDSFREAVDGFVIYAMLGMSLLVIVIVGSMSFKPAEPQDAFNKIVSSGAIHADLPGPRAEPSFDRDRVVRQQDSPRPTSSRRAADTSSA